MKSKPDAAPAAPRPGLRLSLSDEDRFARVVEASPTALLLVGQSGQIEMVNGQAEQMFGYARVAMLGQPVEMLLPEHVRDRHLALRNVFLTDMSPRMMGSGQELLGLRGNGTEFPLEIALSPIDIDGEWMVLAGIIDITARRETEREKEQHRRDLARSNAELEEFAYAASHDLKAPLRAMSHLVQWIAEDIGPTANRETLENLKLLQGRTTRLQMLLDGLLAYSRVGHTHNAVEDVDIADVVHDIVAMLAPPPAFRIAYDGPSVLIRTHRMPIRVVLENLIVNGMRHHDRNNGCIGVSARQINDLMEVRVSDDGPGIESRFHGRIFLVFQTLAGRDDVESSGIGLAIVKKKVEAHGGHIWVESVPPKRGATFAFTWKQTPQ